MDEHSTGASGTRWKVVTRPATVGATWLELFHPGTPSELSLEARVRVVADVTGALVQIHDNAGLPRPHRRHGRLTPRHILIGVDGSASLFHAREPFSKLVPAQPDLGYLAPELLTQSGPASQESDIFSLGVLLWEALDNGRLFPHRRAAAISRLIARRSLPAPRIEEEWAMPLGDIALRALAPDVEARYPDASAFWLALREHLPPPDNARAALSHLAQRALKLELTADIREAPPYLVDTPIRDGSSAPPRGNFLDQEPVEASERYSLRPEASSRRTGQKGARSAEDAAWAITDPTPPSSRPPRSSPLDQRSTRPPSVRSEARPEIVEVDGTRAPSPPPPSAEPQLRDSRPGEMQAQEARATETRAADERPSQPPISTLHVNLPRDIVDAALPYYVPSQPSARSFPWGALSFAALMFFGVGAAVAFGAITAFRSVSPQAAVAPVNTPPPSAAPVAPAPVAVQAPEPPPPAEKVAAPAPVPSTPAVSAPVPSAPAASTPEVSARPEPVAAPRQVEAITSHTSKPNTSTKSRRAPPKARPSKPKLDNKPSEATADEVEGRADSLPFLQQPY